MLYVNYASVILAVPRSPLKVRLVEFYIKLNRTPGKMWFLFVHAVAMRF